LNKKYSTKKLRIIENTQIFFYKNIRLSFCKKLRIFWEYPEAEIEKFSGKNVDFV